MRSYTIYYIRCNIEQPYDASKRRDDSLVTAFRARYACLGKHSGLVRY